MFDGLEVKKMVERVKWMSPIHYEILNFFDSHDIRISPRDLSENIEYDRDYTGKECRILMNAGLLESENQLYYLSEKGRSFLAGNLDPNDLEEPVSEE